MRDAATSQLPLSYDWPADDRDDAPPAAAPACGLGFVLFLLVNGVLFVRPAEIFPALQDLPIYNALMVASLLASVPVVLAQLGWRSLAARPVSLCVVALLPAVVLSNLSHFDLYRARTGGVDFFKLLLYYLLLVGLVNTLARLRVMLWVTAGYIFLIAALALLHHHGYVHLAALEAFEMLEGYDEETGQRVRTIRLMASGIFNDPNDFSLILVFGILVGGHACLTATGWLPRLAWAAPLCVYLYALALTRSRGGFLAMVTGLGVLVVARLGWRRALPIGAVALPVLLVAFGGRQTRIDLGDEGDTGHARVSIWAEGFQNLKTAPVFGIGYGMMAERMHIAAHNSFVHSYTELGFFGGTAFLGAFYLPISYLRQQGRVVRDGLALAPVPADGAAEPGGPDDFLARDCPGGDNGSVGGEPWDGADGADGTDGTAEPGEESARADAGPNAELLAWRPCVLAILASYAVGLCSLSRAYTVPTYLILGVAGAYCGLAVAGGRGVAPPTVDQVFRRLVVVSVCCLACIYLFVRVVT